MPKKYNPALIAAAVSLPLLIGGFSTTAEAQNTFTTQAAFDAATNTEQILNPDDDYAPWGAATCGPANTGQGLGQLPVIISFDGGGNQLQVDVFDDGAAPGSTNLCIWGIGYVAVTTNTEPDNSGGEYDNKPLLVVGGDDDYVISFDTPVNAFAVQLLTNAVSTPIGGLAGHNTTITLRDATTAIIGSTKNVPGDFSVGPNEISEPTTFFANDFIGFASNIGIKTVEITTSGGESQNSGLLAYWAGDFIADADINVHPGSDPNPLNLGSGGSTPVAIFGTEFVDVSLIDIGTLAFAGAEVKTVGKSDRALCKITDIGAYDEAFFDNLDPTPDGEPDLVCHFITADIALALGEDLLVEVTGALTGGGTISGSDVVKVVKI